MDIYLDQLVLNKIYINLSLNDLKICSLVNKNLKEHLIVMLCGLNYCIKITKILILMYLKIFIIQSITK